MLLIILITISFVTLIDSQVLQNGPCPTNILAMANFNSTQFLGLWYDIQHYPARFQDGVCATTKISKSMDVNTNKYYFDLIIKMYELRNNKSSSKLLNTKGTLFHNVTDGKMNLAANWTRNSSSNYKDYSGNYWILATNYNSFALIWGCTQQLDKKNVTVNMQTAWILSREKTLKLVDKSTIENVLKSNNISATKFTEIEDHKCVSSSSALQNLGVFTIALILSVNISLA